MAGMTPRIGRTGSWARQTEDDAAQVLVGTIVRIEGGPHGDWTLHYADGRIVFVDCGYVGATLELWRDNPEVPLT